MNDTQSIENGYLVLTMMPSLYCPYNCSHCYLSLEQRRDPYVMPIHEVSKILRKIYDYYKLERQLDSIVIKSYYYGGEPLSMGLDYMQSMFDAFDEILPKEEGFDISHVVLSSLLTDDLESWLPFIRDRCNSYIQTSYDGLMRGKGYLKRWERQVKKVIASGIRVATISVVNSELLENGAEKTINYLGDLGITESGWLPFMLNEQNNGAKYDRYAPTLTAFNDFMIDLTSEWHRLESIGVSVPIVGEAVFIAEKLSSGDSSNMAVQTLFLLPDGTICLPDYMDGYKEFLRPFGNILEADSFSEIVNSEARTDYMLKQFLRNNNPECRKCEFKNSCLMEFAKENKGSDECFGGKRFAEWISSQGSVRQLAHEKSGDLF